MKRVPFDTFVTIKSLIWAKAVTSLVVLSFFSNGIELGLEPIPGIDCLFKNEYLILFFVDDIVVLYQSRPAKRLQKSQQGRQNTEGKEFREIEHYRHLHQESAPEPQAKTFVTGSFCGCALVSFPLVKKYRISSEINTTQRAEAYQKWYHNSRPTEEFKKKVKGEAGRKNAEKVLLVAGIFPSVECNRCNTLAFYKIFHTRYLLGWREQHFEVLHTPRQHGRMKYNFSGALAP